MIWKVILLNLAEAHGELQYLQERLCYLCLGKVPESWRGNIEFETSRKTITPGVLAFQVMHIYHHVNWAWNCRNADEARAIRCEMRDFRRWEKFPKTWPDLWLPPSGFRKRFPKWQIPSYRWTFKHLTAMRIAIEEAEYALGLLVACVAIRLGGDSQKRWGSFERFLNCAQPITEESFADMMRRLYIKLNKAWNSRNFAGEHPCSKQHFRYLKCFPRTFPELWPKTIPSRNKKHEKTLKHND